MTKVFNVSEFGAVGDGVADDTEAFQAAINEASAVGGTVRLDGSGPYRITSVIPVRGRWASTVRLLWTRLRKALGR